MMFERERERETKQSKPTKYIDVDNDLCIYGEFGIIKPDCSSFELTQFDHNILLMYIVHMMILRITWAFQAYYEYYFFFLKNKRKILINTTNERPGKQRNGSQFTMNNNV